MCSGLTTTFVAVYWYTVILLMEIPWSVHVPRENQVWDQPELTLKEIFQETFH